MNRIVVPVHYDFASSLCFVAHRLLQRLSDEVEELGLELRWRPLDLTQLSPWNVGDEISGPRRDNVLRVVRELLVPTRIPERWPDARAALETAIALEGSEREAIWRERVWSWVYEEGQPLDAGAAERLRRELGIDARSVADQSPDALDVRTRQAIDTKVAGVPTFMLDDWPIAGIHDELTMRSLLGRWARKKHALD